MRALNGAFKKFDLDGTGLIELPEFFRAMERVAVGDTTPAEPERVAEVLNQRMDSMDQRVEIQRMQMQRMEMQMRQTTFNLTRAQMSAYL